MGGEGEIKARVKRLRLHVKAKPDVIERMDPATHEVTYYPAITLPRRRDPIALSEDGRVLTAGDYFEALEMARKVIAKWRRVLVALTKKANP